MTGLKKLGYRAIEIAHVVTVALAPIPYILCERYFDSGAAARDSNDIGAPILMLVADYILAMTAISLFFIVRRMKDGPNEREGLLHLLIVISSCLGTILLFPIAVIVWPASIVGLGIYDLVIIEKEIRKRHQVSRELTDQPIIG